MANNLYALVGNVGSSDVQRVSVTLDVQAQLAGVFVALDAAFREGVDEEIAFVRDWKPDDDQLLTLPVTAEVEEILINLAAGPLAHDAIQPNQFENTTIRALAFVPNDDCNVVYVQYFFAAQRLSRGRLALITDGNTFTRLEGPAFAIGNKVDAIIEGGLVKFKNFNIIKRVFDVLDNYTVASDEQIAEFSNLASVHIENLAQFTSITNQTSRKLISAVAQSGILDRVPVNDIVQEAALLGIQIDVANGKLIFPPDKNRLKTMLRFLDHGVYQSPLEAQRFITNSKRPLQ